MIVNVRCTHCENRFKEEEHVLGQSIPCPSCGLWLKVEAGPVLSGTAMFARAFATEQPKPEPKPDVHHEEKEPSAWRNPAVWIAILAIVAVIIFFLVAVVH